MMASADGKILSEKWGNNPQVKTLDHQQVDRPEGLVDELHQLLLPIADGTLETSTLFEVEAKKKKKGATLMKLDNVQRMEDDVLWLTYKY